MSLVIVRAGGDTDQPQEGELVADRRLFVNAANTRLVEENDPEAAFLLAGVGRPISKADVLRLGLELVEGRVVQPPLVKAVEPAEDKPAPPPANKMASPPENKGAQAGAGDQPQGAASPETT